MRAGVMSAGWLGIAAGRRTAAREQAAPVKNKLQSIDSWDPEKFAREQIRRLVRQVFFAGVTQPTRQVVFSALEGDVGSICLRVGETLAGETTADVAVIGASLEHVVGFEDPRNDSASESSPIRQMAIRLRKNLWLVPDEMAEASRNSALLCKFLSDIRREFEYSIVQAEPAGQSSTTTKMAQAADGVILVVSAQRTRRASALKIKQMLEEAQVRILGTVLSDREFPIPERIYRSL